MAFTDRSQDMDLSTFIGLCEAKEVQPGKWNVSLRLKDGSPDGTPWDGDFNDCHSEFEAKERCFLYLQEKIRTRK